MSRLAEVEPSLNREANVRFAKEDGYTVLASNRPISLQSIQEALEAFP